MAHNQVTPIDTIGAMTISNTAPGNKNKSSGKRPGTSSSSGSSDSHDAVHDNNNQGEGEATHADEAEITAMIPHMSEHYIGYHPTKLYKIKQKLHNSESIAFLPGNRLVVTDRHDGQILIFNAEGEFEKVLVKGVKPFGVATNKSGMVAFTDVKHKKEKCVKVYMDDGSHLSDFGASFGWDPHGITVSNKGLLVVTDTNAKTNCIGVYTQEGKMMAKFGQKGSDKEQLEEPLYVHVDIKDRILVSDKVNHCIKAYDEKGRYLGRIGHRGSGPGCLLNPRGLTEDAYGHILVCDTANRRVSAFTHEGHFIKHLLQASDGLSYPVDIAFCRESGRLAVTMNKANGDFHKLRIYQLPNIQAGVEKVYKS